MVVHLIAQTGFAHRAQPLEFVEVDRKAVGHDEPMKNHRQALLAVAFQFASFAQDPRSLRNQERLAVVRIEVGGHQTIDRTRETRRQPIGEHGFKDGAFQNAVLVGRRPAPRFRSVVWRCASGTRGTLCR
jgi:hypothetical protein